MHGFFGQIWHCHINDCTAYAAIAGFALSAVLHAGFNCPLSCLYTFSFAFLSLSLVSESCQIGCQRRLGLAQEHLFSWMCLCDQVSLILELSVHPYLAATSFPSLKAKPEVLHAALVKIPCLSPCLCRFGWAWQRKITRKHRFVKGSPQTLLLLKYTLHMPSASICAWSLHWILFFFCLGGRNWAWERGRVIDTRFIEINEITSKRESSLFAHNKILNVKLIDWFLILLVYVSPNR